LTTSVGLSGFSGEETETLGHLLYPYRVHLTQDTGGAELIVCREACLDDNKPQLRIPIQSHASSLRKKVLKSEANGIVDVPFDLVQTCTRKMRMVMRPRIAPIYSISTRLPLQYNWFPSGLRNRILRLRRIDSDLSRHLEIEVARKVLIEAFRCLGFELQRKRPPSLLVTHDVDTEKGLGRALSLKSVEQDVQISSIWFLPSHEYAIDKSVAIDLADSATIGSHDVRHDGRLIHIRKHQALLERLSASRLRLEQIFEKEVTCFRSPLLQFSEELISGLSICGYRSDFSVPCWEPLHPVTMTGFGIESVQSFEKHGVVEIPLTLFQDHQVLTMMGMNTREAVKLWIEQARLIREFDGEIVLLVHPDYAFSQDLEGYKTLLASLMEIQRCTLPVEIN
jgi:hypothetical protein